MSDKGRRVRAHARKLWEQSGRPVSGIEAYIGRAEELVAIEDNLSLTLRPLRSGEAAGAAGMPTLTAEQAGPTGEPVEPVEAAENLGELPTLTDQGEEQAMPRRERRGSSRRLPAKRGRR